MGQCYDVHRKLAFDLHMYACMYVYSIQNQILLFYCYLQCKLTIESFWTTSSSRAYVYLFFFASLLIALCRLEETFSGFRASIFDKCFKTNVERSALRSGEVSLGETLVVLGHEWVELSGFAFIACHSINFLLQVLQRTLWIQIIKSLLLQKKGKKLRIINDLISIYYFFCHL